jgi:hypothetical protein
MRVNFESKVTLTRIITSVPDVEVSFYLTLLSIS